MSKNNNTNNSTDTNKKNLTAAEKERLERFEKTAEEMVQQGYTRRNLTINMGFANVFSVVLLIPLFVISYGLYYLVHHDLGFSKVNLIVFVVSFIVLIVVHELIHGICWSIFTPNHFKDVRFGLMKPSMTPYCTCLVPLKKSHYIFGSVMPLILLGIVPIIIAIVADNPTLLFIGVLMSASAAGDILIIWNLARYKSSANEVVYMDHPTEAGSVVFER